MATTNPTGCPDDASFGPAVQGCRDDFDFTITFEKIILSVIPSSIFIALAAARITYLFGRKCIVDGKAFQYAKLSFFIAYAAVQFSRLVLIASTHGVAIRDLSVASGAMAFVAAVSMIPLSFFEHSRSPRPSAILCSFLFLTTLFDIVQTRTAWLSAVQWPQSTDARLLAACVVLKAVPLLLLESRHKTRWIRWDDKASDHSPEETSGVFGIGSFYWLNRLFFSGYQTILSLGELYPLDQRMLSGIMYDRLSRQIAATPRKGQNYGLSKNLASALAWPFLLPVAPRVALIGFSFCQPFLFASLLHNLESEAGDKRRNESYGLIGATALAFTGIAVSNAFYQYFVRRAVYMARGSLASAIYKKTTEHKVTVADDAAAVTLMSTDVENIVRGFTDIHEVWANMVEIALGCWLLEARLGLSFLSPLVVILICSAVMSWVGVAAGKKLAAWMAKIQHRVGLTSKVIGSMKQLKISGMAQPVGDLIHKLRVEELEIGNKFRWIQVIAATAAFAPQCLSQVFAFGLAPDDLNVASMYESLSYLVLLTTPLAMLFQSIPTIIGAFACLDRIQTFLEAEPRGDFRHTPGLGGQSHADQTANDEDIGIPLSDVKPVSVAKGDVAITVSNGQFGWTEGKPVLRDITTSIYAGSLTMVVGPVASGKSTLCKAMLGEVPFFKGEVKFHNDYSSVAFCEQAPFLINGSLKENIIRHCVFEQEHYTEVIEATALSQDIALLPQGDETGIGSAGIALSGGQKCRVSLARALYQSSSLLVLDDILSGLDNNTESEVFRRVFGPHGLIRRRGATAILCTHSVRHLPSADHIIALGKDGTIVEQGGFEALLDNQGYVHSLGIEVNETTASLEITDQQTVTISRNNQQGEAFQEALNDQARQLGDRRVYGHYFRTISGLSFVLVFIGSVVYSVGQNYSTVWIGTWASNGFGRSSSFYIGIYALLRVMQLLCITGCASLVLILIVKNTGAELHHAAITTVLRAPITFFTTTDTGIVLNLFSQDTTIIDAELPLAYLNVILAIAAAVGMAIVSALGSPYLAISYPFLMALLWFIQKFYLRTSRQLRLLDLEAKSPLYANFLDTIKGVATIRAFNWVDKEIAGNLKLLDNSQRPAYLQVMIQEWLMLTLRMVVAVMATGLAALATQLRTSSGFTGASLVTLMVFGELLALLIRFYTALETSIGAIARLKTFSEQVKSEDKPGEDVIPGHGWPHVGSIEIRGLSASYDAVSDTQAEKKPNLVLRDVNLSIAGGSKVAVCGRTGSGKSSFMLVLLRLLDPISTDGLVFTIDDVSMSTVDRSALRKRIIAVPQDCVFLPDGSSIKANLDPFNAATDEECVSALETVQLSHLVPEDTGLQSAMSGDHLSAGQKQLFSLARAILRARARDRNVADGQRAGGIVLLDEVSSGVDHETEMLMLRIIHSEFASYTIVSIAHRLDMVVKFSDTVVVLDHGEVKELGVPDELLDRTGGHFKALWDSGRQ